MTSLRIVLAGELAGAGDHGGASWAMLQWVHGLRALGHDVLVVEPGAPAASGTFDAIAAAHGLHGRAALVDATRRRAHGARYREVVDFACTADVLVNLSGRLRDPELRDRPRHRVYVDLDPAFTQIWHAQGADVGLEGHDEYFTVAARLSGVPDCGVTWRSTLPPVALAHWPVADEPVRLPCTTVANLRSYGAATWSGRAYGQKVHSLRRLADLGRRADPPVTVALRADAGDAADVAALVAHGWRVVDADRSAGTPERYRRFVRSSFAEIGVAKAGYVTSGSGWFSDRTAVYLASGRPAIVQDTALAGSVPLGAGLLAFSTVDDAVDAIAEVAAHYPKHRRAARALAEEHLDARRVLARVLDGAEGAA